jgi:seryl-tRNA synthetase
MADTNKVKIETYKASEWERQNTRKLPEFFHSFGIEQNRYNKTIVTRLRKAEAECRELHVDIQEVNDYYQQVFASYDQQIDELHGLLAQMREEMEALKKENDRLRLTEKLNSNSIDRILKQLPGSIDIDLD